MLIFCCSILGCGESDATPTASENLKLAGLASSVPGAAEDSTERFASLFVGGAAPDEKLQPDYAKYGYDCKESVVSGEAATLMIDVSDMQTTAPVGEVQWTAVLVDGRWKLKDVPLP